MLILFINLMKFPECLENNCWMKDKDADRPNGDFVNFPNIGLLNF